VSRQALLVLGKVHTHLGPGFKALCLSLSKKPALKDELEKCFDQNKFDASIQSTEWSKCSIAAAAVDSKEGPRSSGGGLNFDVPRTDLFSQLPDDCLDKMVGRMHSGVQDDLFVFSHILFLYGARGQKTERPRGKSGKRRSRKWRRPSSNAVVCLTRLPRS
jgi:hypothetical protein